MSVKTENTRINEEKKSLEKAFVDIPDKKRDIADKLIERLAFMTITLQNLEDDVKKNGATYMMENGKQKMLVENPAQKSYNTMINRFTATYDKLIGLLPKDVPMPAKTDDDTNFKQFLGERND